MKMLSKILIPMLVLTTLLISACTGVAAPADTSVGAKVQASHVEFTGVITLIEGNQWTVGGQVLTVDPSVLRDGPFNVGDTVKVEAEVQADGSIVVTRVESSGAEDNSNDINGNDNSNVNDNGNDNSNVNDNGNDNSNDNDNGNDNGNDNSNVNDNGNDNSNDNDNGNDNSNVNDNGNDNSNDNDNDNDNSNVNDNGNDNSNVNDNGNDNSNDNENDNSNDNGG